MKVYKYRGISTLDRDLKTLVSNQFFAPTAEQLNDPVETVLNSQLAASLTEAMGEEVHELFTETVEMRKTVGIYSLSRTPYDELMWSHYGESHEGFCIEYDLERLISEARANWDRVDVVYSETPPVLDFSELLSGNGHKALLQKLVGYKSKRWEYEDELRIVTTRSGKNNYAEVAVTGIYLGCRCTEESIDQIRHALKGRLHEYFTVSYPEHSYALKASPLERDKNIDGEPKKHRAPVEESAISACGHLRNDSNLLEKIEKAVEIVRCDPSCELVVLGDVSASKKDHICVMYKTNVETGLDNTLSRFFPIHAL